MSYALRLVRVPGDQCQWCGGLRGQHDARCDVPALLAGRPHATDAPSPAPAPRPSRDEYYEARQAQAGL